MTKRITLLSLLLALNYSIQGQIKNPEYIKNNLTADGVFDAPHFEFTNDYDSYNPYNNIEGLFMDGLDFLGSPTKVFGWYGVPENLAPGETAPAVVLLHGGGGKAYPVWVKKWTDKGYIAIALSLEGQVPDNTEWAYGGPLRVGVFADATKNLPDQWAYHAVADAILANSLLRSFPEVDTTNIGITGISWGGILTNIVTGIDHRFKFSIPVYGAGYLYDSPWYKNKFTEYTEAQYNAYLQLWEPSLYMPAQQQPTLLLNGTNDFAFSLNTTTSSYKTLNNEKYLRIEHNMAHGHPPGWEPEAIYQFADYITKGDLQPLRFTNTTLHNRTIQYEYNFEGMLNEALLYYTTDTVDWGKDNYEWLSVNANLDTSQKIATAQIPSDAVAYFMNINNTDTESIYSSIIRRISPANANCDTSTTPYITLSIYAYLEGAYDTAYGEMTTTLNTRGLLPGQTPINSLVPTTPVGQPYHIAPWNYAGNEGANWTNNDYQGNETDWVLVSFRTGIPKNTEVAMTAALLQKNGHIRFPKYCILDTTTPDSLYIVLEHRNHIGIMSPYPIPIINNTFTYDFRSADSYRDPSSFGQKLALTNDWLMYAGDTDQSDLPSYDITGADKDIWIQNNGIFDYYLSSDLNLDGETNGTDKTIWVQNNGISSRVPK